MLRQVPNILTFSRLILAAVFFALLSRYQYELRGDPVYLAIAFLIYLVALITDFFDGYFARKLEASSTFGRITDPFVDKILVLGSFIFFAGRNFVIPANDPTQVPNNVQTITGVAPWMVVLILARELLVTTFRGFSEASGKSFGAEFSGKLKMTLQSVTILAILTYVNFRHWLHQRDWETEARILRDAFIWATVIVTVYSGLSYVKRAAELFREPSDGRPPKDDGVD